MREGLREVPAQALQPGDLLFPTNRVVLSVGPSANPKKVVVVCGKNGRKSVGEWWRSTIIAVQDDFEGVV